MSHIIMSCHATPVNLIWDLAKYLWPHDPTKWPQINLGLILGVGCLVIKTPNTEQERDARNNTTNNRDAQQRAKNNKGASRLLQILILKAAHLIWILRCERVIQEKHHDPHEIRARWFGVINRQLTEDKITATKINKCKSSAQLVEATWDKVLRKFSDPPYMWIHNREVLVGSIMQRTRPIAGHAQ